MRDRRLGRLRHLPASLRDHRDGLAVLAGVAVVIVSFVGLLWLAQSQVEVVLNNISPAV